MNGFGRVGRRGWFSGLVVALLAAALGGCGGGEDRTKAQVRFVNASSGYEQLDLSVDDSLRFTAVVYGADPGRTEVDPDQTASLITRTGSSTTLLSLQPELEKNRHYTLLAWGAEGALRTALIDENADDPDNDKSSLRVLNAVPDGDAVDVYLTAADEALDGAVPVQAGAKEGELGAAFVVDSAAWRLRVTAAGSKTDVRLDLPAFRLDSRQISTLVLTPASGGVLVNALRLDQQAALTRLDSTQARVRVVAGLPDSGAVYAKVSDQVLARNIGSPAVGLYSLLEAGPAVIAVGVNGSPLVSLGDVVMTPGGDHTLMVFSPTATPQTWAWIADDNRRPVDTSVARLRLVHGVSGLATALALTVDFVPVADGVVRGSASGYSNVTATLTARLTVTTPGVATPLFTTAEDQVLQAGSVYTLFIVGSASAPVGILRKDH